MTLRAPLLAALLAGLLLSSAASAGDPPSGGPVGVDAFVSAVRDGNSTRLLAVWPSRGAAVIFGRKVDHAGANAKAKFDEGVFELLRWPKDGDKGVLPQISEVPGKKGVRSWVVSPTGKPGPRCTLRSLKGAPAELVECVGP
jgi:hypothetical protein